MLNEFYNSLKIMEWNINGRAGYGNYSIPEFVADEIVSQDADIVILTEFVIKCNWDYFRGVLEKKYKLFSSPYISEQNGVLIALKKDNEDFDINSAIISSELNAIQTEKPNFLKVTVKYNKKPLTIIGTRICVGDRSDEDLAGRKKQRQVIYDHLESLNNECRVICMGDFNATPRFIWEEKLNCGDFKLDCPSYNTDNDTYKRINKEYCSWSYVHEDGKGADKGKASIDHIIVKGLTVADSKYIWDFVNENNGYGSLRERDYKSHLVGYPDHAILSARIAFND